MKNTGRRQELWLDRDKIAIDIGDCNWYVE